MTITQEIVVDEETLLFVIYELDRRQGPMPAASLLGYQKYRPVDKGASISPSPSATSPHPHSSSYGRSTTQHSPSYILPMRYSSSSSGINF